ncbi:hypothetical protein [Pantoea cypripedii]|uniref:Uncharacterized protein n=1 Tax=Pantoea cypripedii TaxID=55209 RepID=A0A6B9G851_PANCY|nr:hypothetical protein [Pantoea cypripedii]QGY31973.1 hypothetical protein CUN67_23500 [Pantoea cypripedii]
MNDNRPVPWPWAQEIKNNPRILKDGESIIIVWPLSVQKDSPLVQDLLGKVCQIHRKGDVLIQDIVPGRITICLDEDSRVIEVFEESPLPQS